MATTEERDIPELQDLVTEIENTIKSLDNRPAASFDAAALLAEIKNTVLPLIKDVAESTLISLVEIRDIAEPVELTGQEADEMATLLAAFRESQKDTNPQLVERIDNALAVFAEDEDDEDSEEEDAN